MRGLYLVTPDCDNTQQLLEITELALRGGAALVQYRHKTADAALRLEQAECLQALCRTYHKPFIINDHLDLCLALNADGIHVGGTDESVARVRAAMGPRKIVGASCYGSMELAHEAYRTGASYIAFGGFYPSRVKQYPVTTSPDIISQAKKEIPLPNVVIGGMTCDNAAPLVANGADMVAAISSIYLAGNPQSAARAFSDLFESGQ
ncbi:MAG TPA: thiamine phosphate synthase [Burkholderiaceae bacterium]|nr:thiamine phosphate synthase [Burkholderiaceae bacterium]